MTIDKLREAVNASPFRPFTIRTADGERFQVPHRDFVSIPPTSPRIFIVWDAKVAERHNVIDVMLVTSLEYDPPGKRNGKSSGGGKRKKAG